MKNVSEIKKLDNYLCDFLYAKLSSDGFKELSEVCNKILAGQYVKGLDKYSKNVLALALEKRIMITIETEYQNKNQSYWKKNRITTPYINHDPNILINYIGLTIRNIKQPMPINDTYSEIKKFYNQEIVKASKKFINGLFSLPSGQRVSVNDLIDSLNKTIYLDTPKREIGIKNIKGKLKSVEAIAGLVTVMSVAIISNKKTEVVQVEPEAKIETDIIKEEYKLAKPTIENQNIEEQEIFENEEYNEYSDEIIPIKPIFIGYDCECAKEYQEYIYKVDQKYNVPFNIHMTILDNESDGRFDTNGVKNSSNDYGFAQINECNLKQIQEHLGYTKEDILNDPYKNIEASAWLLSDICQKYKEDIKKGNYENVFGAYNGWVNWKQKPLAVEYASKAMQKVNTKYNKSDEELYDSVIAYVDGENNGKGL